MMHKMVCVNLDYLGRGLDDEKNNIRTKKLVVINFVSSKVKVLVMPTNEELEIAKQTYVLLV